MDAFFDQVKEQLARHEGLRLKPYHCTAGKLSIGYGRNLDDRGISRREARMMLDNDVQLCVEQLRVKLPDLYNSLNSARRAVLINMCFNMGVGNLLTFRRTLACMMEGDFSRAADEMLDSLWAGQVGARAIELSEQMRKGEWL